MIESAPLAPGLHLGIPESDYLALDAIGSTHLSWLAVSPLFYRYMRQKPRKETDATRLGTAVHLATLQPEVFARAYCCEPDPAEIAPDNAKPRATKAYRDAVAGLQGDGFRVLDLDEWSRVHLMADAVRRNPHVSRLFTRCPDREVAMLWDRDGRLCRGRADILGGVMADLKTTRSLATFSPFAITRYRYYVQAAWYLDGAQRLGLNPSLFLNIVVESSPPFDVGVFEMDAGALIAGEMECERLRQLLDKCERDNDWPGQFPDIQRGTVTDALAQSLTEEEVA